MVRPKVYRIRLSHKPFSRSYGSAEGELGCLVEFCCLALDMLFDIPAAAYPAYARPGIVLCLSKRAPIPASGCYRYSLEYEYYRVRLLLSSGDESALTLPIKSTLYLKRSCVPREGYVWVELP